MSITLSLFPLIRLANHTVFRLNNIGEDVRFDLPMIERTYVLFRPNFKLLSVASRWKDHISMFERCNFFQCLERGDLVGVASH